jgi:hypothetical protein
VYIKPILLYAKAFLLLFFESPLLMAQTKPAFEITFGVYRNDHYNRTFHAEERKWILKEGKLTYFIDAHDKRYSNTLVLKRTDLEAISKLIKDNELLNLVNKDLTKDYLDKYELTIQIKGKMSMDNQNNDFMINGNGSSIFDEDLDARRLKQLEDLLYQIIENNR